MSLSAVPPPGSIASPAISESGPSKSASLVAPQYSPQLARNHKAVASSSSASPPLSSPSFPTSSSRSNATGSQLGPRTPTTASTSVNTHPVLHPNLPSPLSPEQTAQARAALVGTISNLLDSELQSRASLLHSNAAALEKQEREVAKATEALRKENDKLIKVVKDGSRKVLETGNVQNWAEVLERDFLVLEDTMRRVRKGGSDGGCSDPDCSGCSDGSGSWSGSRTPSRRGSSDVNRVLDGGDVLKQGSDDKGKAVENVAVSLDDHHVNTDETMGVDVPNTVAPPELGEQESVFASVENAISASISEAMATSISDLQGPLPIAKTEPQPLPEATVDNGRDQLEARHDEPVFDIPNSSADMEVDHDQPAPQTEADTEMPSKVTDYQSEAPYSIQDNAAVNDDKMDIDVENGVDQHPTSIQTDHPA